MVPNGTCGKFELYLNRRQFLLKKARNYRVVVIVALFPFRYTQSSVHQKKIKNVVDKMTLQDRRRQKIVHHVIILHYRTPLNRLPTWTSPCFFLFRIIICRRLGNTLFSVQQYEQTF